MNISILCTSRSHPVYGHLQNWAQVNSPAHRVELVHEAGYLSGGDFLFLISCTEVIGAELRAKYRHTLVVHASRLPHGRGWSPHVWQIIEGRNAIPVTLLEAEDEVDGGRIWVEREIQLAGHELYDEINSLLFDVTLELMDFAINNERSIIPSKQAAGQATYYRKRIPEDSRLDPGKTIAEQFNLLRVADPRRFPCFFDYQGHRYRVTLHKES